MISTTEEKFLSDKRVHVLVTGADGQLGTALRAVFNDDEAVFVRRDEMDITDFDAVKRVVFSQPFTHVINCAAYTAVDKAETETELCRRVNVDGVHNIIAAIKDTGAGLIHFSTDYVFDGKKDTPYVEDDDAQPLSVYGRTKRESEVLIVNEAPDSLIIRTGWLYSPYGRNFVKTILAKGLETRRLRVVNDQTGTPTNADDLAAAVVSIVRGKLWTPGIFHYTNQGEATWYDFASEIARLALPGVEVQPCTTADFGAAALRPAFSVLDKTKIKETYNLQIPDWRHSLSACLRNIKQNLTNVDI